MNIPVIAGRNVMRYWHRTAVTTLTMAFAGFIMVLFVGLIEGFLEAGERNAVILDMGDIQVHAPGYRDDHDFYLYMKDYKTMLDALEQAGLRASGRLFGFALAASGTTSSGAQLRGIDPDTESRVTELHRHVWKGDWLDTSDKRGVVLGRKLARSLDVKVGSEVVIVGQASDGSMANDLYQVRGILKTVSEAIDRSGFFMVEDAFRELMYLPDGAHEIAVMRPDRNDDLESATAAVRRVAGDNEVLNWKQLNPVMARMLETMDAQIIVMILITYIAVGMVILNAMLMSVFERIREFGVMKALGVLPWQLGLMIILETLIQVIIAAILAALAGWRAVSYFAEQGIDMADVGMVSSTSVAGIAIDPIVYMKMVPSAITYPVVFLFVIALLSVLYPMMKAMLVQPVRAIHDR